MTLRLTCLLACVTLVGCGKQSSPPEDSHGANQKATPTLAVKQERPQGYEPLHQSFLDATRKDAPADSRPPELTLTGKSVGVLYETVVRKWDSVKFMKDDGTRIHYSATVETSLGNLEIALDPDRAPNHVRNFVCLSQAGYYDGLVFDRVQHDEANLALFGRYEEIEAGCPLGTGDPNRNSIGYWLKPEIAPGATHEPGTVGACHGIEKDSAACKFYVSLSKAPYLDEHYTIFGKVTSGLDVAKKIFLAPVVVEDSDMDGSRRPLEAVVIRKVTIHTREGK